MGRSGTDGWVRETGVGQEKMGWSGEKRVGQGKMGGSARNRWDGQ